VYVSIDPRPAPAAAMATVERISKTVKAVVVKDAVLVVISVKVSVLIVVNVLKVEMVAVANAKSEILWNRICSLTP
jgi:hypothetical protein